MPLDKKSDSKDEAKSSPAAVSNRPSVAINVRDPHLGLLAYAPLPEVPKTQKEKEAKGREEQKLQALYSDEKRVTTFSKSPASIALKLPDGIPTQDKLKEKIRALKSSPDSKNELTALDELNRQIEQNNVFEKQFDWLIGEIEAWALNADAKSGVDKKKAGVNLEFFRGNLFTDGFAGNQPKNYFEDLKYLLEKFYVYYLRDDTTPENVKAKRFNALLPHLTACGPGAHTHLQGDMKVEPGIFSLEGALSGIRTQIISELLPARYVDQLKKKGHPLYAGSEIHTKLSFFTLAKQLGLNPAGSEIAEPFHSHTLLDEKAPTNDFFTNPNNPNRKQFESDFKNEFTYGYITNEVFDRLRMALWDAIKGEITQLNQSAHKENQRYAADIRDGKRKLRPELKIEGDYWPVNSAEVRDIVASILKSAEIELDEDFLEYNAKGTHAKLKKDILRDKLMLGLMKKGVFAEGVLHQSKIYFYQDYIPEENALVFAERVQEAGMKKELEKLKDLPEPVKEEMELRLLAKNKEGIALLENHLKLKQAITKEEDLEQIKALLKIPDIDLKHKLGGKESLWEYTLWAGKLKALELLLDANRISPQERDEAFKRCFQGGRRFELCDIFLKKGAVSEAIKQQVVGEAIRSRQEKQCKYLLDKGLMTKKADEDATAKADEKRDHKEAALRGAPDFFKPSPLPPVPKELEQDLQDLSQAVVMGNMEDVEKFIQAKPQLLLYKGRTQPYFGRPLEGHTAYQMALAVEDAQMAAKIKEYLIKVANEKTADDQYREQRPNGWEETEKTRWAPAFGQLQKLTLAIKDSRPGDIKSSGNPDYRLTITDGSNVAKELRQFRSILDGLLKELVTTGRAFNSDLLLEAFKIYGDYFKDYFRDDWSNPKAMCFVQQVIGYTQRLMPANDFQAHSAGLNNTMDKLKANEAQGRGLRFLVYQSDEGGVVPVNFGLFLGRLGVDYFVDNQAAVQRGDEWVGRAPLKLVSIKSSKLTELMPQQRGGAGMIRQTGVP